MKKLILLSLFAALAQFGFSQVMVNDLDINTLDIQYIEVYDAVGIGGVVRVNYGQIPTGVFQTFGTLLDPEGKPFKNNIAAINYLYLNGWELFQLGFQKGDASAPSFFMQRRKD